MSNTRPLTGAEYVKVCVCMCERHVIKSACQKDHSDCIMGQIGGAPRVEAESSWEATVVVQVRD